MRDDMSPNGVPAAIFCYVSFFVFVAVTLGYDEALVRFLDVTYTITYGTRYLIYHYPVAMLFLFGAFVIGVVALLLHFLADMPLLPR